MTLHAAGRAPGAPLAFTVRSAVKTAAARLGLDVRRVRSPHQLRPLGDLRAFLSDLAARGMPCDAALDVGANRGDWATALKAVFPDATVDLIEPQAEMTPWLDAFCARHPQSRWIQAGAGAEVGELDFEVWEDRVGSTFLHDPFGDRERRRVPVVTVDGLLDAGRIRRPDIVKLDVQGFELEVLAGAASLFGSTELFIVEVALFEFLPSVPTFDRVVKYMADREYDLYDVAGFIRRPSDGALAQIDACFARRTGYLRRSSTW